MIEINLVPDVKQEFIRAKRVRNLVISGAVLVGIASVGVVVLLALYLFAVQNVRNILADEDITSNHSKLSNVEDIENTLTVQNQLTKLDELHNEKNIASRFFDLLIAVNPTKPNNVSFSLTSFDAEAGTISLEGQSSNGYAAADVLKKTILGTSISYNDENNEVVTLPLTEQVNTSELSFGEDSSGKKVLHFSLWFEYDPAFFARSSTNAVIIKPNRQNVTDSYIRLPDSLFVDSTLDLDGGDQ